VTAVPEVVGEPGLRIIDCEQRSEEWYEARRGIVTASVVGRLITPKTIKLAANDDSRGLVTVLAAERITGHVEETWPTRDMWRGIEAEPYARDLYSEHHAPAVECGFMVRQFDGFRLGYSPDGLVGDDGLVEIKSPRPKGHLTTILADAVPLGYMAQLQAGLLVSGRPWIDYVSYCGGMPLWVKRVTPDERWQTTIIAAVEQAETAITETVANYTQAVVGLPATERINFNAEMVV
jgi:hypothetical protein